MPKKPKLKMPDRGIGEYNRTYLALSRAEKELRKARAVLSGLSRIPRRPHRSRTHRGKEGEEDL